jgi:hypothetical protein
MITTYKIIEYKPKEDITAYEVALIVGVFYRPTDAVFDALPECARRHFVITEMPEGKDPFEKEDL